MTFLDFLIYLRDFDNDGHGDIALGWFNPIIADRYGFSKNSAGVVYFNNGNNDWTQRESIELPTNFFEANGNANDMEVFDFNNDGYLDIVLASTIHEPYYNSRVIQFFQNEQGKNFIDVTAAISPDHSMVLIGLEDFVKSKDKRDAIMFFSLNTLFY